MKQWKRIASPVRSIPLLLFSKLFPLSNNSRTINTLWSTKSASLSLDILTLQPFIFDASQSGIFSKSLQKISLPKLASKTRSATIAISFNQRERGNESKLGKGVEGKGSISRFQFIIKLKSNLTFQFTNFSCYAKNAFSFIQNGARNSSPLTDLRISKAFANFWKSSWKIIIFMYYIPLTLF